MLATMFALVLLDVHVTQLNLPPSPEPLSAVELSVEVTNNKPVPVEITSIDAGAPLRFLSGSTDGSGTFALQRQSTTQPRTIAPGETATFRIVREISARTTGHSYETIRVKVVAGGETITVAKTVQIRAERPIVVRMHYRR